MYWSFLGKEKGLKPCMSFKCALNICIVCIKLIMHARVVPRGTGPVWKISNSLFLQILCKDCPLRGHQRRQDCTVRRNRCLDTSQHWWFICFIVLKIDCLDCRSVGTLKQMASTSLQPPFWYILVNLHLLMIGTISQFQLSMLSYHRLCVSC